MSLGAAFGIGCAVGFATAVVGVLLSLSPLKPPPGNWRLASRLALYLVPGAVVGLLLWFYVSSAAILIGAEVNAELAKAVGKLPPVKEAVEPGKEEKPQVRRAS